MTIESQYDGELKDLLGMYVEEVHITPDKDVICFAGRDKIKLYRTEADCCSKTWIENITGVKGIPGYVVDIEDLELPSEWDKGGCVFTQFYGVKITLADKYYPTTKIYDKASCAFWLRHREFLIEYRNESNGYYGGSLVEYDIDHVGDFRILKELEQLKEDF